jgi:prepilin-type N-terminal cleavage/methylation domain-containing protein
MPCSAKNKENGFTIVELLIAMVIALIVLTALTSTFLSQRKTFNLQGQITEMVRTSRNVMDMISREVMLAGYSPTSATIVGIPYASSQLEIRADLSGDGDTGDTNEDIIYTFDGANHQITRAEGATTLPLAENIEAFTFQYYDADGNNTTTAADIRQIEISVTTRTAAVDPNSGAYRTSTLTSYITPPNLDL